MPEQGRRGGTGAGPREAVLGAALQGLGRIRRAPFAQQIYRRSPLVLRRAQLFYKFHGHLPRILRPRTFSEKVNWRVCFDRRELIAWTCDKLRMKQEARLRDSTIGIPGTIWRGTDLAQLAALPLPDRWVLKANHASQLVHLGTGRPSLAELEQITKGWLDSSFQESTYREWAYGRAERCLLVEEWIGDDDGVSPPDLKFFCFDGEVAVIQVDVARFSGHHTVGLYDTSWRRLPVLRRNTGPAPQVPAPDNLSTLLEHASRLSAGFDFVRVDLYDTARGVFFGEYTTYPGSGLSPYEPPSFDRALGDLWTLPRRPLRGPRVRPASRFGRGRGPVERDITVLMVEERLGEDGAARSNLRLVARWSGVVGRIRLFVVRHPVPGAAAPLPPGVHPEYPEASGRLRLRWALPWSVVRAAGLALRSDVVVSGREVGFGLLAGRAAAAIARKPFVCMIRSAPGPAMDEYLNPALRPPTRLALRTADRLVCISPGLAQPVQDLGVDPARISVVLNGVEVQRVVDAASAEIPSLPPGDGPLVVGIGRLDQQKGFDVLVRAHARVLAAGVRHRLLILGEGSQRPALEALVDELGLGDTVRLPGFVPNPLPALAAADLYCLTSRWEGFAQTLAEALVVGTPVIATDCVSGPRYLLGDGSRGDLVPVDDVDALTAAIERHLRAPDRLAAVASAARDWALENLDVDRTATQVLDILREVSGSRAAAVGAPSPG